MRKIFPILIPIYMEIKRNLSRFGSVKLVGNIVVVMAFGGCLGCVSMARIDGPYFPYARKSTTDMQAYMDNEISSETITSEDGINVEGLLG